jgi:hypothetical protein
MSKVGVELLEVVDVEHDERERLLGIAKPQADGEVGQPVAMCPEHAEVVAHAVALQDLVAEAIEPQSASLGDP